MLIMLIQTRTGTIQFANAKFEPGVESKELSTPPQPVLDASEPRKS
jgi:hypothetical protein